MLTEKKRRGRPKKKTALIDSDDEDGESSQQYTSLEAAAPAAPSEESMEYEQSMQPALPFSQQVSVVFTACCCFLLSLIDGFRTQ